MPDSDDRRLASVTLYTQDGVEYRAVTASVDRSGVRVGGVDMGPTVESAWNADEYEFWVRVAAADVPALTLALIRERWADQPEAVAEFGDFCRSHDIPCQSDSWLSGRPDR